MAASISAAVSLHRRPLGGLTMNSARRLSDFREELEAMEMETRRRMIYDLAIAELESLEAEETRSHRSSKPSLSPTK